MDIDHLVVGGGLSGLYAARLLLDRGAEVRLLEARDRLGGRILSEPFSRDGLSDTGFDLGPSWFWPGFQPRVRELVDDLGLRTFPQPTEGFALFEDEHGRRSRFPSQTSEPRSFRIEGGVGQIVEALAATIPSEALTLSTGLQRLESIDGGVRAVVEGPGGQEHMVEARRVLLAAPPRLLARSVDFQPPLPEPLRQELLAVPTWMAGHAKVLALYDEPIWRHAGGSGQAFSRLGPLGEIHDASPEDGGPFALFGFVGLSAMARKAAGRTLIEEAIAQLERLFGPGMLHPLRILHKDWSDDPRTATSDDFTPLSTHPTYGLREPTRRPWDGRLTFCSTEVSVRNGGYLEGALEAARKAVEDLD